jgi:peptide-methionine (S)-S-oxide reductase
MGCASSSTPQPIDPSQSPHDGHGSLAVTIVGSEPSLVTNHQNELGGTDTSSIQLGMDNIVSADLVPPPVAKKVDKPVPRKEDNRKVNKQMAVLLPNWDKKSTEKACFGAGCYWGTEKFFRHDFSKKYLDMGIIQEGEVGFMGPANAPPNPNYRDVCTGTTGHVEVYDLKYSGGDAYYEEMVRFFFQFHDPTTLNRQGNDRGTQYASVIYCYTDKQFEIATRVKKELQELLDLKKIKGYKEKEVMTDIRQSTMFFPAHAEHQDFLMNNPNGYCNHRMRFNVWPNLSK